MGGFARVALPVATAIAAPYAAQAVAPIFLHASTNVALPSLMTETFANIGVNLATQSLSWSSVAMGGLSGLANAAAYNSQQQAAYQQAVARNQQIAYMQQQQALRERQRRDKLKKLVAAERARFGAMGLDSSSSSAGALIKGLRRKVEDEIAIERNQLLSNRRNLLEASHPRRQSGFQMLAQSTVPAISLLEEQ